MTNWNQKIAIFASLTAALLLLAGCQTIHPIATPNPIPTIEVTSTPGPTPEPDNGILLPQASGELVEENDKAAVDYSHTEDGYIMARREAGEKKMKLRLAKLPEEYTYDLTEEEWTAFPLSQGDGAYTAAVYEQVEGTTYANVLWVEFDVELSSQFAPFLRPNQQLDYTNAPQTIAKAAELTEGASDSAEKVERIFDFVASTLQYDDDLAAAVESGYIPALDQVLEKEKGICLDFTALMTAMVRSQAIPCKLVVGNAGATYHAWVEVWNETAGEWVRMDPTFTASGKDLSRVEYAPRYYY